MQYYDIFKMAAHNLWQRKMRTALNLIGIVVGCIVLLMTIAGVTGVKQAIHLLFDSAEAARQIGVYAGNEKQEPPAEAIKVVGKMSDERRERLSERLEKQWQESVDDTIDWKLTSERIRPLAELPHVQSVVPSIDIRCTLQLLDSDFAGEQFAEAELADVIAPIDTESRLAIGRLLAGRMLAAASSEEVLVDEFTAYRLGYRDDDQLDRLVGKQLEVSYQPASDRASAIYGVLTQQWQNHTAGSFSKQVELMTTLAQLMGDLDATTLSEEQKVLLRNLLRGVQQTDDPSEEPADESPALIRKTLRIAGVLRLGSDDELSRMFKGHWFSTYGGVYVSPEMATEIFAEANADASFYGAIVTTDSTRNLAGVVDSLKTKGMETWSALRILENIDEGIDESGWVVLGIAAAILLTAAIGVSNTLWISVLERTPEFGILKSVGATDSTLVLLMVCEGAMLGLVGAVVAIAISLLLGTLGSGALEWYVESRINQEIASGLFQFSLWPLLGVVVVSVMVCMLASVLPAWRAGRLDPVVALRRT